jgi:hypothetical protein
MHNSVVDHICLAAVEKIPHVQDIGSAVVTFEVRGAIHQRSIQIAYQPEQSVGFNAGLIHLSILEAFDLPRSGEFSEWVKGSCLRAMERSIEEKSHSGHAGIATVNGDMYMLTIRMLPVDPDREQGTPVNELQEASLRTDASLVQAGFTPHIVNDVYGKPLFHGILLVPECGFEVHSPDSLQVSLVTPDSVLTVISGTPEKIVEEEWDSLARAFSGDLGVFPAYDASGRTRSQSRFSQLSGAIQGAVVTGKKVVAAHVARGDAIFIVNPVPSARALDAYHAEVSNPLTNGWL